LLFRISKMPFFEFFFRIRFSVDELGFHQNHMILKNMLFFLHETRSNQKPSIVLLQYSRGSSRKTIPALESESRVNLVMDMRQGELFFSAIQKKIHFIISNDNNKQITTKRNFCFLHTL
jgi:hypothetical protein